MQKYSTHDENWDYVAKKIMRPQIRWWFKKEARMVSHEYHLINRKHKPVHGQPPFLKNFPQTSVFENKYTKTRH